jgi:hypothetical protein
MVDGGMGMGWELEGMTLGGWKWMEKASSLQMGWKYFCRKCACKQPGKMGKNGWN